MADLISIFGGEFRPIVEQEPERPEVQLERQMRAAGIEPPPELRLDGELHRFKNGGKSNDKSGWYIIYPDGTPAGKFGCWRSGIECNFRAETGREISAAEEMAHAARMAQAKKARDEALKKRQEVAADTVEQIWSSCIGADNSHPYLTKKGIKAHGARVTGDGRLVVPLFSPDGALSSLQYIAADGSKLYHAGGKTSGAFWWVGAVEGSKIFVAEGFATAATIHEHTQAPCVVAYSASNLVSATAAIREQFADAQIIIVADNDASGIGQKYADQASAKYNAKVITPPDLGDANDYAQAGGDLTQLLTPKKSDWLIQADEFSAQPAPLEWLLKRWIPRHGLIMVHGPSGGGKTFVVLDWCLSIASNKQERFGHKVRPGAVVYLAGEGHHGLKGRIAAWKQHNYTQSLDMYLSRDGCDLNTPEGYQRVVDSLRDLPTKPSLIVVDTLHRFLAGDENSAQDAKTMLDACGMLINEFNCAVLLVHHTGVSGDAKHRARGSSAWRGALDIEISITPPEGHGAIEIRQMKSKDSEIAQTLFAQLESVEIWGWKDEDDQPVTSAIVSETEEPEQEKEESSHANFERMIERAWTDEAGKEVLNGMPYVSRAALKRMLEKDGLQPRTAQNYMNPSYHNKIIGYLINARIIAPESEGWVVTDSRLSNVMMLLR